MTTDRDMPGPSEPEPAAPLRRGRGRRPIADVRAAVLHAAGDLLLHGGMRGFSIERVAERSGVSKTTIYKWWPSKGALALDAYFHEVQATVAFERVAGEAGVTKATIDESWPSEGPLALDGYLHAIHATLAFSDTGNAAHDLLVQLRAFVHLIGDSQAGRIIAELIGEAQTDPDLAAALHQHYTGPRRALAVEVIERGQRRGQLRGDIDPETVVDQLWGACYHRLLVTGLPMTEEFAVKLMNNLLDGLLEDPTGGMPPQ